VYWLWRELNYRGHTVQVVSFKKLYPHILFPGTTQLDTSGLKLDAQAIPILTSLNPSTWVRAFKAVKAFSPDVILFQWWQPFFAPVVGVLLRMFRRAGLRCVVECHNVVSHEGGPLDRALARFALSPADHLITHSIEDRDDVLALIPGMNVTASSLPLVHEFSGVGGDRSGRTILFFGMVRKYKGLDVLLTALPAVLRQVECKLNIVGEFYDDIEEYKKLIRELDIESRVNINSRYVSNEEVPAIFQQADVLVMPYLSATQSGVARIALSCGLPVIASRTGGLSEAVEENVTGLLFPPGDAGALASQLVTYFTTNLGPAFSKNIRTSDSKDQAGDVIEQILRTVSQTP